MIIGLHLKDNVVVDDLGDVCGKSCERRFRCDDVTVL
jgi:hypothetical protein